jgi:hypothetical protein
MLKPCKTLEEFVRKYDKDMERILCKSFRKYINLDELPEVKNDVYAHLLEKNFFNTYDPTKAQFSTYLYTYLFKFLKSKKVKNDKDPTTYAACIDTPLFDDSSATLIDLKDFAPDAPTVYDSLIDEELESRIRKLMKNKHRFEIKNPYAEGTLEHRAWDFLLEPKTIEQIEEYVVSHFSSGHENPYHPKKDEVKHIAWNSFWKNWQTKVPICLETQHWSNIAGVRKVVINPKTLPEKENTLYRFLLQKRKKPLGYMDIISNGFDDLDLYGLIRKGYVEEKTINFRRKREYVYEAVTESHLSFNYARNLAWHMIHLMKEEHPEFMEFHGGCYHLNTKTDVTYRVLQMILNGKTKKQITSTLNISTPAFNEAKESMFKDIRKLIEA